MPEQSIDTCPLCGEANRCDQARSEPTGACWCLTSEFSEQARDKLASLDGRVCICRGCATAQGVEKFER